MVRTMSSVAKAPISSKSKKASRRAPGAISLKQGQEIKLMYEQGKHIRDFAFPFKVSDGRMYDVNISTLFLPLQPHEEHGIGTDKDTIPYGGDLFGMFYFNAVLHFFLLDIMGHGIAARKFAEYLMQRAVAYRNDLHIAEKLYNEWDKNKEKTKLKLCHELEQDLEKAREELDIPNEVFEKIKRKAQGVTSFGTFTSCEALVNLVAHEIRFKNIGNPQQYFVVLINGKAHLHTFASNPGWAGLIDEDTIKTERIEIDPNADSFKLVMFTDGVPEQPVIVSDDMQSDYNRLLSQLETSAMKREHRKFLKKRKALGHADQKLLIDTLHHLRDQSPRAFVDFVYQYFIGLNSAKQGDDFTFVVVDFVKRQ